MLQLAPMVRKKTDPKHAIEPTAALIKEPSESVERLKDLWESRHGDVSQAEFGERYGLGTQGMVSQYLTGRRPLNIKAAKAFAHFLKVEIEDLSPEIAHAILDNASMVAENPEVYQVRSVRSVPVVGTAQLGMKGFWMELEHPPGFGEGRIQYGSRDRNAYAVRVIGDSMFPRIKSGEYVVCEPNAKYGPDDDVLVVTADGRSMVKRFVVERDDMITLESYNQEHGRMTLRKSEILKIHRVAAITNSAAYEPALA